jgi:hypothetical protein
MSCTKLSRAYFACLSGLLALTGCGGGSKGSTPSPVKAKGGVITASTGDKFGWQRVSGNKYCANAATSYIELKGVIPIPPYEPIDPDASPKDIIIGDINDAVWMITIHGSDETGQYKSAEGITLLSRPVPCALRTGDTSVLLGVINEGTSRLLDDDMQIEKATGSVSKRYEDMTCAASSPANREGTPCEKASEVDVTLNPDTASPRVERYQCSTGQCEVDIGIQNGW